MDGTRVRLPLLELPHHVAKWGILGDGRHLLLKIRGFLLCRLLGALGRCDGDDCGRDIGDEIAEAGLIDHRGEAQRSGSRFCGRAG